jgi:DNA-binding MarR family transcriptional regulator
MCSHELDLTAALVRGAGLISDICAAAAAQHQLTVQQAQLLCVIATHSVSMAQLGALLRITKSSATGLVDRAEEAGLVLRVTDVHDRRSQIVELTPRGERLGGSYRAVVTDRIAELIADIDPTAREALRSAMSRVVLSNQARDTWPTSQGSAA